MATVLVTGGSSGIGLATVRRLAAAGDRVFAASRRPSRNPLPEGVTPLAFDVADPVSARRAVESVLQTAGALDALVNNAGLGLNGPLEEVTDDAAKRMFEVNLFGPMRLAVAAVAAMRPRGGGRIVNVTSMNDVLPAPFAGWYSASKAALASASAVLGAEVHEFGIRVSVVAPGFFLTEMARSLESAPIRPESVYRARLEALRRADAGRLDEAGDPDEVAAAIEGCIRDEDPPARVVVGSDARRMENLVRTTAPDDFARLLRDYVAGLGSD